METIITKTLDLVNPNYSQIRFTIADTYVMFKNLSEDLYEAERILVKANIINTQTCTLLLDALNSLQEFIAESKLCDPKIAVFLKEFRIEKDTYSPLVQVLLGAIDARCDSLAIYGKKLNGVKYYTPIRDIRKLIWKIIKEYDPSSIVIPYQFGTINPRYINFNLNSELENLPGTLELATALIRKNSKLKRFALETFSGEIKEKLSYPNDLGIYIAESLFRMLLDFSGNVDMFTKEIESFKNRFPKRILICAKADLYLLNKIDSIGIKFLESVFDKIYIPDFESDELAELDLDLVPSNIEIFKTF